MIAGVGAVISRRLNGRPQSGSSSAYERLNVSARRMTVSLPRVDGSARLGDEGRWDDRAGVRGRRRPENCRLERFETPRNSSAKKGRQTRVLLDFPSKREGKKPSGIRSYEQIDRVPMLSGILLYFYALLSLFS